MVAFAHRSLVGHVVRNVDRRPAIDTGSLHLRNILVGQRG